MKFHHREAHVLLLVLVVVTKVATSTTLQQASATTPTSSAGSRSASSSSRRHPRCGSSSSSALASLLRLRGAEEQQHSPRRMAFVGQLRDRFTRVSSSSRSDSIVLELPSNRKSGVAALLHQVARAFKGRLMQSDAGARRGWLALVAVAFVLSVVRATTSSAAVSCQWVLGRRNSSGRNLAVVVADTGSAVEDEQNGGGSSRTPRLFSSLRERRALRKVRMRKNGGERRRRLLMTPRFPLAYMPWWKALRDRREREALTIAEGVAAEDHEVTERAEGAQIFRAAQFWGRSATIYLSYKKMQAKCALELPRVADLEERELKRKGWWDGIHELNSDRMLKLCLDLRGFYLKSGQFLGTRHDFMPKIFLQKLGKLHDDVPPMPASRVSTVLSRELDVPADELFSSFNLTHPVGSASISQVHRGVLRETGENVAVKVQYPGAERVMLSDLRNLKVLAWFLQKFELNFDILSSLKELSKQIKGEFDFRSEATTMDRMHESLGAHSGRLHVPTSRLSTKRVLIMSYLEGESLAQLKRGGKERFKAARKRIGKNLLHELADAWGYMIFEEGLFNADPHPGNILIMPEEKVGPVKRGLGLLGLRTPKLRIGLLDWGQTKELSRKDREKVAKLILAVSSHTSPDIVRCFNGLGVKLSNPDDADSVEKLALVMFDTRTIKGLDFNPFSDNNVLKLNSVQEYPQDLYFILRTVLMFRGMAQSLGVEFSIADKWAPHARRLLASTP